MRTPDSLLSLPEMEKKSEMEKIRNGKNQKWKILKKIKNGKIEKNQKWKILKKIRTLILVLSKLSLTRYGKN